MRSLLVADKLVGTRLALAGLVDQAVLFVPDQSASGSHVDLMTQVLGDGFSHSAIARVQTGVLVTLRRGTQGGYTRSPGARRL